MAGRERRQVEGFDLAKCGAGRVREGHLRGERVIKRRGWSGLPLASSHCKIEKKEFNGGWTRRTLLCKMCRARRARLILQGSCVSAYAKESRRSSDCARRMKRVGDARRVCVREGHAACVSAYAKESRRSSDCARRMKRVQDCGRTLCDLSARFYFSSSLFRPLWGKGGPTKVSRGRQSFWLFSVLIVATTLRPELSLPGRGGPGRQPIYIRTIASLLDLRGSWPPHVSREENILINKPQAPEGG